MVKVLAEDRADISERELVLRCQRGDRAAFCQMYRRYQQRVRSTLYQLCGPEMLEDLAQEVFLRAWKGLPQLRQPSYFATWLYRICWNVATDRRRQLARQPLANSENSLSQDLPSESESNLDSNLWRGQDVPDLMQLHYQDLVQRGLEILSLEHRAVLVLHDLEDIPQKEVAEILNIPVGTVKSRLFHARSSLRKFFEQQGVSL